MMSLLDDLKNFSTVVADTGNLYAIRKFLPKDATTNPSIVLKTVKENPSALENIIKKNPNSDISDIIDNLLVSIGVEILNIIPGRVSTEVDASLSFNIKKTIEKARGIIALYEESGIPKSRVLIKIASTWEGIQAAKILEAEGIHCNMTLIFSMEQAVACAEAGVTLISPFVGRILDWHRKNQPDALSCKMDPGVESVKNIFSYYKQFGYKTEIMAASFRNSEEIISLSGCDLLTISPDLLNELSEKNEKLTKNIMKNTKKFHGEISLNESEFRFKLNENAMATEKLSEGIRNFCRDTRELESLIKEIR